MKNLKLILASAIIAVSLFAQAPSASAFSSTDCKKGTMYYDYYKTTNEKGEEVDTTDEQKAKLTKPKDEIKTIADCNLPASSDNYDLMDKGTTIINVIVGLIGIIAVAVIVIGGILYATSAGDAAKAKKGQNAIMYGIVGLIIALLAFAIVNFVLKSIFS